MDLNKLQNHVDIRFDKLEDKLDNHLERLSKAETEIHFLKGHAKLILAGVMSVMGAILAAFFKNII